MKNNEIEMPSDMSITYSHGDSDRLSLTGLEEIARPSNRYWGYVEVIEEGQNYRISRVEIKPSGLSVFYLWIKTLETDTGIRSCELPIYRFL